MKFLVGIGLILIFPACSGSSSWGEEMSRETPVARATMFRGDSVSAEIAAKVFEKMVAVNDNFASDLPEQVDRVDGRLTLRLGNDNEDSIQDVMDHQEESGVTSYMRGLAAAVSAAVGGEPVDIILCRQRLDQPFHTVVWEAP